MPRFLALLVLVTAATGFAAEPYSSRIQLQVRSNIVDGYNLPANSSFNSKTPALSDLGEVAVCLSIVGGDVNTVGVWLGSDGSGSPVWTQGGGAFISDCSLNDAGLVVFVLSYITPDGIYFYDASDASSGLFTDRPLGASGWTAPTVNDAGTVGFRASFSGSYAWVSSTGGTNAAIHAADDGVDAFSPYWYLYTPAFNDQRVIAGKVSLAADHDADQIVRCDASATCSVVVEDQASNPTSPFAGFDNSVGLDSGGRVAFKASLVAGGEGIFLSDGGAAVTIATTAMADISQLDYFAPRSNDRGEVVFRAYDGSGLLAVFVGDGSTLWKVATEHDLVSTDLGTGRIDQHDASKVFGGNPVINDRGEVAFIAALTPEGNNQVEWGSGLFVATPDRLFGDGFEGGDVSAWSGNGP